MTTELDRLEALLADEATDRLGDEVTAELEALLARHPDVDRYAFERAAAAVFLAAGMPKSEGLPDILRARLAADADKLFGSRN